MEADPSGGRGSNRIVVQHATGLGNFLPLSQRQRIEQIPGVVATSPEIWFGGVYKDDKPENFFGQLSCDPDIYFSKIFDDSTIGPGGGQDLPGEHGTPSSPARSSRKSSTGSRATTSSCAARTSRLTLDLVYAGSYRSGDESNIFFSNEVLNQGKWFGANKYTGLYYTKIARAEDIPRVTAAIDQMFENSDAPSEIDDRKTVPAPVHGDDGKRQGTHPRDLDRDPLRR